VNHRLVLVILLAATVLVATVAPFVGMEKISPRALWDRGDGGAQAEILWKIRIPRVCLALVAGAALAASGMVFQAMFRNPLAEPFTLGVSSGASLGAAVCIHLDWNFQVARLSGVSLFAFGGALLSVLLVFGLARAKRGFSMATMLLAGVAVSFFFSSMILFLQYLSDFTRTFRMLRWVMGGMERVGGFDDVLGILPFAVTGCLIVVYLTRELNLLATGEELATSRGVEVSRTKVALLVVTSLMVGAVVAVCGPVGFVGLMAPHICRLLVGADHRYLAPATLLFGGLFLALCDTAARTVIAPT